MNRTVPRSLAAKNNSDSVGVDVDVDVDVDIGADIPIFVMWSSWARDPADM